MLDPSKVPLAKVSIGMPVYNGEKYLRDAIESILNQTFSNFELLLSDNASTDATADICQKYARADARVRCIRQSQNLGAIANFRYVMEMANTPYFMWLAADDMMGTTDSLANAVRSIEAGFELAIPDVMIKDEATGINHPAMLSSLYSGRQKNPFTRLALKYPSYIVYGLFRTDSVKALFIYLEKNSDLTCFVEGIFVHAATEKLKCVFVSDALLIYRRHPNSESSMVGPQDLLTSFLKYTGRVFSYYLGSTFSRQEKVKFLSELTYVHGKYILFLSAAFVKSHLSRVRSNRDNI